MSQIPARQAGTVAVRAAISAIRRRFRSELLDILRTGHHPDGRTLGPRLRPALIRITIFLERDPELGAATGRTSP